MSTLVSPSQHGLPEVDNLSASLELHGSLNDQFVARKMRPEGACPQMEYVGPTAVALTGTLSTIPLPHAAFCRTLDLVPPRVDIVCRLFAADPLDHAAARIPELHEGMLYGDCDGEFHKDPSHRTDHRQPGYCSRWRYHHQQSHHHQNNSLRGATTASTIENHHQTNLQHQATTAARCELSLGAMFLILQLSECKT